MAGKVTKRDFLKGLLGSVITLPFIGKQAFAFSDKVQPALTSDDIADFIYGADGDWNSASDVKVVRVTDRHGNEISRVNVDSSYFTYAMKRGNKFEIRNKKEIIFPTIVNKNYMASRIDILDKNLKFVLFSVDLDSEMVAGPGTQLKLRKNDLCLSEEFV